MTSLVCWVLVLSQLFLSTTCSELTARQLDASLPGGSQAQGAPLRNVYAVSDIDISKPIASPETGRQLLYGHSFLHLDGTALDGAYRAEHIQPQPFQIAIRGMDYGVANNDKKSLSAKDSPRTLRKIYLVGQTRLTNAELLDPATGKGLLLDVWAKDPVWVQGSNCCNQFVQNLVKQMGLKVPHEFNAYVADAAEYAKIGTFPFARDNLPLVHETIKTWDRLGSNERIQFDTSDLANPKLIPEPVATDEAIIRPDALVDGDRALNEPLRLPWDEPGFASPFENFDPGTFEGFASEAASDAGSGRAGPAGSDSTSLDPTESSVRAQSGGSARAVSSVRIAGVTSNVAVVLESTARAVGVAGLAIAPVFIIIDLAQGNWVGGAFGAVGLLLGILAVTAFEGPIGWLVGGLAALFSILPTLFGHAASDPPSVKNATEIIQYAMFGDIHHTGNEKCRQGSADQPGNPNCTAVYGPGVIGAAFKWDNFDPIAFMLHFNNGFAMSIPDMAAAFHVIDSKKAGDGADQIATISCKPPRASCGRVGCRPRRNDLCATATFALNRKLITIPVINQTADQVYDRIIPKAGGDCKLISNAGGIHYPSYNLTVHGAPAAIACNLTASLNVSGSAVLANDSNAMNGRPAAFTAPTNASTDGSTYEVAAPSPPTGLAVPYNSTNSLCLSGAGGNMCFPNGTYAIQRGSQGFSSERINSMTLPDGASLAFIVPKPRPRSALANLTPFTYKTNQSNDRGFATNFGAIAASALGPRVFNVLIPDSVFPPAANSSKSSEPPAVCLYTEAQFKGDVACFGLGTGNVSSSMQDLAQSVKLHGPVTAWVYGAYYGDDGGQFLTVDLPDLKDLPYGTNDNFSKRIKAMWVIDGR